MVKLKRFYEEALPGPRGRPLLAPCAWRSASDCLLSRVRPFGRDSSSKTALRGRCTTAAE
jgi:hypothetical protein